MPAHTLALTEDQVPLFGGCFADSYEHGRASVPLPAPPSTVASSAPFHPAVVVVHTPNCRGGMKTHSTLVDL